MANGNGAILNILDWLAWVRWFSQMHVKNMWTDNSLRQTNYIEVSFIRASKWSVNPINYYLKGIFHFKFPEKDKNDEREKHTTRNFDEIMYNSRSVVTSWLFQTMFNISVYLATHLGLSFFRTILYATLDQNIINGFKMIMWTPKLTSMHKLWWLFSQFAFRCV